MNEHLPDEPVPPPPTFESEITALCKVLEAWREERKTAVDNDPNEFPKFERKAGWQALVFYIVYGVSFFLFTRYNDSPELFDRMATLPLFVSMLISAVSGAFLLVLQACGLAKRQFWRALFSQFRSKDTYPFSALHHGILVDLQASDRLRPFSTNILTALHERIGLEENDLKERLNVLIGNPTILVWFGLVAGVWTTWKGLRDGGGDTISVVAFMGSAIAFLFFLLGAKWRLSLFDLTHCRLLLALEIARRKFST